MGFMTTGHDGNVYFYDFLLIRDPSQRLQDKDFN